MARTISKTLMTTRVSYKTVEVVNGEARFVDHTDAVFSGLLEKDKVERLLRAQLGKDTMVVVTNVDAGQHKYEMSLEAFVLNARIADGEPDDSSDDDDPEATQEAAPNAAPDASQFPAPDTSATNPDSKPVPEISGDDAFAAANNNIPPSAADSGDNEVDVDLD